MVTEPILRPEDDPLAASAEADVALADFLEQPVSSSTGLLEDSSPRFEDASAEKRLRFKKGLTFGAALLSCICAGTVQVFSLYAPQIQTHLRYTQIQVNILSILSEMGMYLTSPIVGISADVYGSGILSFISAVMFATAYGLATWAYAQELPFFVMCISFLLLGTGTACMYFGSITACAKTFSTNRGLALGLPITSYGLSGLWQSQMIAWLFTDQVSGDVNVPRLFAFFAVFLFLVGLTAGVLFSAGYRPHPDLKHTEVEHGPIKLGSGGSSNETPNETNLGNDDSTIDADEIDVEDEADLKRLSASRRQIVAEFTRDWTAWALAAGLFATTGPGEMFLNNMGSVIRSLGTPGPSASTNVSILTFFSTSMRIVAGVLSDIISKGPHRKSRMILLLFFAGILALGHFFIGLGGLQIADGWWFWLVSAFLGSGYGAVFTLAPTIVSLVWGAERFGTHWGVLFVFPAIGSIVYELIYAAIYDYHVSDENLCYGLYCYRSTFLITGASSIVAILAWAGVWRLGWHKKGIFV